VSLVDPGQLTYFGGRIILNQSHGEGMLTFFRGRYAMRGLYLLDEPEAALSPSNQVDLARMLFTETGHYRLYRDFMADPGRFLDSES